MKTKILFFSGLVIGIAMVFLGVQLSSEADSSDYAAQVAPEPQEEETAVEGQNNSSPIVERVTVSAAGAYTMDGEELYNFRADKRWPIASITKLMTALVADKLYLSEKPYELITITEEMVATEGNSGGLEAGDRLRADDLIEAMMLVSSNDAAAALAVHYGEEEFVAEMNRVATELGMADTNFVDPTGLSVQNLSTVEDLRRLVKFIWEEQPYIFEISSKTSGVISDAVSGSSWRLDNINEFAQRADFLGGKTGTIPEAEGNLVSIFNVSERENQVIVIVLGTEDRFAETDNILEELSEL